jgi:hypothetical protein
MPGLTVLDNAILALQATEPMRWSPYLPAAERRLWGDMGMALLEKWSLRDKADESNKEFREVMKVAVAAKSKPNQRQSVDVFLGRYDHWKRAVADALDRNFKNLGGTKPLDDYLNRYRNYSRMP